MVQVSTIILAHGAWTNSSVWTKVLPLLNAAGIASTAAQLPLTGLADDAATLNRAIALADGPVLLVGHSYGGVVITETGTNPKVTGLIYVAGFALGAGESADIVGMGAPLTRNQDGIVADEHGFLKLTRDGVVQILAHDLSTEEQAMIYATQGPIALRALTDEVTSPAWRTKPSWYLRTMDDRALDPVLQDSMSKRTGATMTDLGSGHIPMLSQPNAVAEIILSALD